MLKSMTGYGSARFENEAFGLIVEVKTLNSKFFDLSLRLPKSFSSEKEIELRNIISQTLERGKIYFSLDYQPKCIDEPQIVINEAVLKSYFLQYQKVARELQAGEHDLFRLAAQMPDVALQNLREDLMKDEDWQLILTSAKEALKQCEEFRLQEGKMTQENFLTCVTHIEQNLVTLASFEAERMGNMRERMTAHLKELESNEKYDTNRFEQEMIYYLEKLDISEEKVRLKNHLDYFKNMLKSKDAGGKKLNFISQEIGREINTIGSKANHAGIQKCVVEMKDELEKIKEQTLNIL